jgi:16S rRNA (uracil1498-N3)-methyltransferase
MKVRIFIKENLQQNALVTLSKEHYHYLAKVLRLKTGDKIFIFNQNEGEFEGIIFEKQIRILHLIKSPQDFLPSKNIKLVFSIPKKDACHDILYNCTGAGANEFFPITTKHSVVHGFNLERAEKICTEAAEQSERISVPKINPPQSLEKFLSLISKDSKLIFCDEKIKGSSNNLGNINKKDEIFILIGPEGGFSSNEREKILALSNTIRVSLGENILTAETACVCACFLINMTI